MTVENKNKDEQDEKPAKNPHLMSVEVGGLIGAIAGYLAKDAVITGSSFWSRPLFVGVGAAAGALAGMVLYYIWEKCFKRFYDNPSEQDESEKKEKLMEEETIQKLSDDDLWKIVADESDTPNGQEALNELGRREAKE